jgi:hypothetical protein
VQGLVEVGEGVIGEAQRRAVQRGGGPRDPRRQRPVAVGQARPERRERGRGRVPVDGGRVHAEQPRLYVRAGDPVEPPPDLQPGRGLLGEHLEHRHPGAPPPAGQRGLGDEPLPADVVVGEEPHRVVGEPEPPPLASRHHDAGAQRTLEQAALDQADDLGSHGPPAGLPSNVREKSVPPVSPVRW